MMKQIVAVVVALLLFCPASGFSETKEIISEGTYNMGDGETPTVAKSRALLQAKRTAVEEAGAYVESYKYEKINVIINSLIAFGTVSVAFLAIWGEWVKSKLIPPKLVIKPHNLRGTVTRFTNGPRVIYYHLKVVNYRPWSVAKNCRVILHGLYRRSPDQQFHPLPLPVPPQFVWAPAELTPSVVELSSQQILDFGRVVEGQPNFQPVLYSYPNDFQGFVAANEAVRYALEISADGYATKRFQVFEVAWNGRWSDNLDQMTSNLVIHEITEQEI